MAFLPRCLVRIWNCREISRFSIIVGTQGSSKGLMVELVLIQASLRRPTQRLGLSAGTINVTVAGAVCIMTVVCSYSTEQNRRFLSKVSKCSVCASGKLVYTSHVGDIPPRIKVYSPALVPTWLAGGSSEIARINRPIRVYTGLDVREPKGFRCSLTPPLRGQSGGAERLLGTGSSRALQAGNSPCLQQSAIHDAV